MSTLHRFNGYRVAIRTNDHRPAHVHVTGKGGEGVFKLHCPEGPPELREAYGLSKTQIKTIIDALTPVLEKLCKGWRETHGKYV